MSEQTLLSKLRDAARTCSNVDYRAVIQRTADDLQDAVRCLYHDGTTEANMRRVNGAWSNAVRILKDTPPEGSPAPLSGSPEPAKLAAAA